jgi:hypothetical protein
VGSYSVTFKAPAGEGEPWKPVLRRAASEAEARQIFIQAEAALDAEREGPARADVRASRTIKALGESYLDDSRQRGKAPRTLQGRESRLNAHVYPTIGDVPVAKWRVEHSRKVMEKGSKTIFSMSGREDLRGQMAAMRKLAWRLGWRGACDSGSFSSGLRSEPRGPSTLVSNSATSSGPTAGRCSRRSRTTGRVAECPVDEMNRPRGGGNTALRIPPGEAEVGTLFAGWRDELATCRKFAPTARNYAAARLMAEVGLRVSEACGLDLADIK